MVRLQVSFHFVNPQEEASSALAEAMIVSALRSLYGQVGASQLLYEVESWDAENWRAALKADDVQDAKKIWTGLMMMSWFNSNRLRTKVTASGEDLAVIFPAKVRKRRYHLHSRLK